jgi:ketosteroid isomerase-like protein
MSRENAELVKALLPQPGTDVAPFFRDEDTFARVREALRPLVTDDFQSVYAFPGQSRTYEGLDGFRKNWLDWLEPWVTYRTTIEEVIDVGERVVVLFRDRGLRKDLDAEVECIGAQIWTFRDEKVARIEEYADRTEALKALKAAGLTEEAHTPP